MAKPYSVTPHLSTGRKVYAAVFRNSRGERVHKALPSEADKRAGKVLTEDDANLICQGLVSLHVRGVKSITALPIGIHPRAVELYFEETGDLSADGLPAAGGSIDPTMQRVRVELERYPKNMRGPLLVQDTFERLRLTDENNLQRREIARLTNDLETTADMLRRLQASMLGRAAEAAKKAAPIAEALEQFGTHMKSITSTNNAGDHIRLAKAFIATLPADAKNMAMITGEQISTFLDAKTANGDVSRKASRRRACRITIGRFVNWGARTWGYPSQMLDVPTVSKNAVLRERGDIHWHDLTEVERILKALPGRAWFDDRALTGKQAREKLSAYWRALVATLGYAGLQLAELAWLRVQDLELSKDGTRGKLWVTTVEDPENAAARHALKTGHRRRAVDIHPKYLLPRLKEHIAAGGAGTTYLFPIPEGLRRRIRTENLGSAERWIVGTLSTTLRGHNGGKDLKKRPATLGLLPDGMNAKSLRRTFGSLLLRSGKSTAEVAAAMGNTEDVVRQHYARILGQEVDVDF